MSGIIFYINKSMIVSYYIHPLYGEFGTHVK